MPLSVETSTPPTLPPPASVAMPLTVSGWPTGTVAPAAGAEMVDIGRGVAASSGGREPHLQGGRLHTHVSEEINRRLTHGVVGCVSGPEWSSSRPHAHCTVPAPKTRAPLGARYIVRWWVAEPGAYVLP